MINISDLRNRYHSLELNNNCLYFQKQGNKLESIPFSQFIQLPQNKRKEVLSTLEKAIVDGIPNLETRHKIQEIRNAIFHSGQKAPPAELLARVPRDLWSAILSHTSPKTVEVCKSVSKTMNRAATAKEIILSINRGHNMAAVFPKTIESLEDALILIKNSGHGHLLTCADLTEWDVDESDLEKLFEICPNLISLSINSPVKSLPKLPSNLQILECYDADFDKLPELPASLKVLRCVGSNLSALPTLPSGLQVLDCSECPLQKLPSLPFGLSILAEETAQYATDLLTKLREDLKREREDSELNSDEPSRSVRSRNDTKGD